MIGQTFRFTIGSFECVSICDAAVMYPVAENFSHVPADELEAETARYNLKTDVAPFSINILLINAGDQRILVDTGGGAGMMPGVGQLPETLATLGIEPGDIDRIIITHGHGDHIGGITNNQPGLTFPNARYSMWKTEWDYWLEQAQKPTEADDFARRNLLPIQDRVELIEQESEIVPGLCLIPAPGHTLGHIAVLLQSGGEGLLHMVDAAHFVFQVSRPEWSPRFDVRMYVSAKTRRRLLERAADENLLVMTYHFPSPGLGRVTRKGDRLAWRA